MAIKVKNAMPFMNKVGKYVMSNPETGDILSTGVYNTSTAVEITQNNTETTAGGGALVMLTGNGRRVKFTLVSKTWDLMAVSKSVGSSIEVSLRKMFKIQEAISIDENGIGKTEDSVIGTVGILLPNGVTVNVMPSADNEIDLSKFGITDACVKGTYAFNANVESVVLSADNDSEIVTLVLQSEITNNIKGRFGYCEWEIPSAKFDGNISLTTAESGEAAETSMTLIALATDGTECREGMSYGCLKQYKVGADYPIAEITASPDPIELAVGETETLAVTGNYGAGYSEVGILNSECAFTVADSAVATVSADGTVTGVAAGSTEVLVTYTASGISDTVEVEVS
jgi:hypothetical protein